MKIDSPKHRKFVATQPCIVTGMCDGVQSHHLLRAGGKSMGRKACDSWCVPLHYTIHDALHRNGNEMAFFAGYGLDYETVKEIARSLCKQSPCKKINQLGE